MSFAHGVGTLPPHSNTASVITAAASVRAFRVLLMSSLHEEVNPAAQSSTAFAIDSPASAMLAAAFPISAVHFEDPTPLVESTDITTSTIHANRRKSVLAIISISLEDDKYSSDASFVGGFSGTSEQTVYYILGKRYRVRTTVTVSYCTHVRSFAKTSAVTRARFQSSSSFADYELKCRIILHISRRSER
jgi:hypothetical protein